MATLALFICEISSKAEYYHLETHDGIAALEAGVHDYIRYYNHERIKLGLQGLSPVEQASS